MSAYFYTSGVKEIHIRRYQKLQEALAIVTTMVNLVKMLCAVVMNSFFDKIYFEHLINVLLLSKNKDEEGCQENKFGIKTVKAFDVKEKIFDNFSERRSEIKQINK